MQDTFGDSVAKLIGYARVSTKAQDTDRHVQDLLAAGVRRDDLYIDHGVNGARAAGPDSTERLRHSRKTTLWSSPLWTGSVGPR